MKRSPLVEIAHKALKDNEKGFAEYLLETVNLTLLEKEIIRKTVLDGLKTETSCMELKHWHNRFRDCSESNANKIKRQGMLKIGEYLKTQKVYNPAII